MVSTRGQGDLPGDEEDEREQKALHNEHSREKRRVDPVMKEVSRWHGRPPSAACAAVMRALSLGLLTQAKAAAKRGLNVDQLHNSQTPAWGNLRRRSRLKQASYFEGEEDAEDEVADQHVGSDDEEGGDEGEQGGSSSSEGDEGSSQDEQEEEGEGGVVQPRYSRRQRATVQRYSPKREARPSRSGGISGRHGGRGRGQFEDDLSDLEEYNPVLRHKQHSELFAERYSVRERRVVDFYNPAAASQDTQPAGQPSTGGGGCDRGRERERDGHGAREPGRDRSGRRDGGGGSGRDRSRKRSRQEGSPGDEGQPQEGGEAADGEEERKQYSLRDRALVTIKPLSQVTGTGGGAGGDRHGGSGPLHKRPRGERRAGGGGSRLRRVASRGHLGGRYGGGGGPEEEEDDIPDHPASPWRALQDGGKGQAGGLGGHQGGSPPSWDLALAAAQGLPLGQLGGGDKKGGNAEITPLQVDPSVSFDAVGGLDHYIRALKEMIFLPLVYPELFERFHITPPRGVLFYGPPGEEEEEEEEEGLRVVVGTGKTLVARALAAHASRGAGRKVSFFMRKGADVLSKWVGEAERQLRLLFEEAQRHQPAIIFFDEIDGLAPVRSSKQDQIHNSIVSTLLALMDGLDSRGQVVIIGATNRVDALDGALRRPGRFDRELLFPLPNLSARAQILRIHTRKWAQPPSEPLLEELASRCVGYCGADLKALCTEASLQALRRRYPQIYSSDDRLLLDPTAVAVEDRDFMAALGTITPASHRSAAAHARGRCAGACAELTVDLGAGPLPALVSPLLADLLRQVLGHLQRTFPPAAALLKADGASGRRKATGGPGEQFFPSSSASAAATPGSGRLGWAAGSGVQRPRLLVCGPEGAGQSHLGPAALYALEGLPVHAIGLPSLLSDAGARSPEEALVHAVVEARRAAPAILFLPHLQVRCGAGSRKDAQGRKAVLCLPAPPAACVNSGPTEWAPSSSELPPAVWWDTAPSSLRATLWVLLADLPPDLPLLLLATADVPAEELDPEARTLFGGPQAGGVFELPTPTHPQRQAFFHDISRALALPPPREALAAAAGEEAEAAPAPPQLPRDPGAAAAEAAARKEAEEWAARQRYEEDQAAMRALRMALRDILLRMLSSRKWDAFAEPVSPDEDPHYWDTVSQPMDLATLLARVDARLYATTHQFLAEVALIPQGEREYWGLGKDTAAAAATAAPGTTDSRGIREVSRACALEDEVRCQLAARVPAELAARLDAMQAAGGPAPAPPGLAQLVLPTALLDSKTPAGFPALRGAPGRAQTEGGAGSGRRATRTVLPELDDRLVHTDPEAAARRIRMMKKAQEAALAAAGAGTSEEEQQLQQQQPPPGGLVGEPTQPALDLGSQAGEHDQQQQQQQQPGTSQPAEDGAATEVEVDEQQQGGSSLASHEGPPGVLAATTKDNVPERLPSAALLQASAPAGGAVRVGLGAACEPPKTAPAAAALTTSGVAAGCAPGLTHAEPCQHGSTAAGADKAQQAQHGDAQVAAELPQALPADLSRAQALQRALADKTQGLLVEPLEGLHAKLSRLAMERLLEGDREAVARAAVDATDGWLQYRAQAA
ncbi:hypothetical protein N2152v2_009079 [Parachlorella kessleri]